MDRPSSPTTSRCDIPLASRHCISAHGTGLDFQRQSPRWRRGNVSLWKDEAVNSEGVHRLIRPGINQGRRGLGENVTTFQWSS
jgi:hypothetical protein